MKHSKSKYEIMFDNKLLNIKNIIEYETEKQLIVHKKDNCVYVGINHNLSINPVRDLLMKNLKIGDMITEQECLLIFDYYFKNTLNDISYNIPYFKYLKDNYKIIIIVLTFFIGIDVMLGYVNLLSYMRSNDVKQTHDILLKIKINGKHSELLKRLAILASGMIHYEHISLNL